MKSTNLYVSSTLYNFIFNFEESEEGSATYPRIRDVQCVMVLNPSFCLLPKFYSVRLSIFIMQIFFYMCIPNFCSFVVCDFCMYLPLWMILSSTLLSQRKALWYALGLEMYHVLWCGILFSVYFQSSSQLGFLFWVCRVSVCILSFCSFVVCDFLYVSSNLND